MKIDGIELTIIDDAGDYDYSWSEFAVMRGDDGYLYVGDSSGCSCYGFEDNLDEITRVTSWQEAAANAQEWAGSPTSIEHREVVSMIERLMTLSPPAFDPSAVLLVVPAGSKP